MLKKIKVKWHWLQIRAPVFLVKIWIQCADEPPPPAAPDVDEWYYFNTPFLQILYCPSSKQLQNNESSGPESRRPDRIEQWISSIF